MNKDIGARSGVIRTRKRKSRPKKAYVTAAHHVDTSPIRRVLEARGVSTLSPDELNLPSQDLTQFMREAMDQADLVVALVDATGKNDLVFYELGLAQALKKPSVVLLAKDASPEALVACGIPYLRFNPLKPDNLEFSVDQMLAVPHHGTKPRKSFVKRTRPIGDRSDELLARLRKAGRGLTEKDFRSIIADAMRMSGVPIISMNDQADNGIDLAVWSDDLAPWIRNPLLVELKGDSPSLSNLSAAARQVAESMAASGTPWALLIYHGSTFAPSRIQAPSNVLPVQAEVFLNDLRDTGFGDLVRRLRNQRVHGGV